MTKRSSIVGILSIVPCEEKTDFGVHYAPTRDDGATDRGQRGEATGAVVALKKTTGPPDSAPSGPFVADEVLTIVVLWVCWTACTFLAVPHAASDERCVAPHAAVGDPCVAPRASFPDLVAARRAVVGAVSWLVPEWWVPQRLAVERLALERLAVPEPRHLTALVRWSAPQSPTRQLVREGKARLDARYFFESCHRLLGASPSKYAVYFMRRICRFD
jgi:hypothetical protein